MRQKKLSSKEIKALVDKTVVECNSIAKDYIRTWKPENQDWDTIEGSVYIRLSTPMQVIVEKGSLEQQIYIAISEAVERSKRDTINFKIVKFFIEPGITGKH